MAIIATEPVTGIQNKEATFKLKVTAKLVVRSTPECFANEIRMQIGEVREIEVPEATNSRNI